MCVLNVNPLGGFMDLLEIIKTRRSVRSFDSSKEVKKKDIDKILEAAIWSPSAGNAQPWKFIVVTNSEIREGLYQASHRQEYVKEAPFSIVVCIDKMRLEARYAQRGAELYSIQDTAAAVQNILLMAHSLGLGTCWIGAFDETQASKTLKLDESLRPVAIIPIGYATEKPVPPHRDKEVIEWKK